MKGDLPNYEAACDVIWAGYSQLPDDARLKVLKDLSNGLPRGEIFDLITHLGMVVTESHTKQARDDDKIYLLRAPREQNVEHQLSNAVLCEMARQARRKRIAEGAINFLWGLGVTLACIIGILYILKVAR